MEMTFEVKTRCPTDMSQEMTSAWQGGHWAAEIDTVLPEPVLTAKQCPAEPPEQPTGSLLSWPVFFKYFREKKSLV